MGRGILVGGFYVGLLPFFPNCSDSCNIMLQAFKDNELYSFFSPKATS